MLQWHLKVECALNIMVSIHDLFNKKLSHLARLDEQNGLCGQYHSHNQSSLHPVSSCVKMALPSVFM